MKSFYAGAGVVFALLLFMTWNWSLDTEEVSTFHGIVDTTETVVSAEIPVEIGRVAVTPGQTVRAGDTLLLLASAELEKSIAELRYGLNEARVSRIASDREIQAKVAELEAQYNLNRRLLNQVRGPGDDGALSEEASPLRAAITGLRAMLAREEVSTADMEAYLSVLLRERDKLIVIASEAGVVGTVNHRAGEKVPAFDPILTLHNGTPSSVRGYIHESALGRVEAGRRVRVRSLAGPHEVPGEIVGVGHRIVEYPVRLRKRPDIQVWGREVTIAIPPGNRFLLGEKVTIVVEPARGSGLLPGLSAHAAAARDDSAAATEGADTAAAGDEAEWLLEGVEASGLVHRGDADEFLVVNDDTPKKRPLLHRVGRDGAARGTVEVEGLEALNDMEAVARAGDTLFIATSLSHNKSGRFPDTRRLLVRAVAQGVAQGGAHGSIRHDASVDLHAALSAALRSDPGDAGAWFRAAAEAASLDMEGLAVDGRGLLLGFKSPLLRGRAVILRIHDRDALFRGAPLTASGVSLWRAVALELPGSGARCGISDLLVHEGRVHVLGTAVTEGGSGGAWWTLDPRTGAARLVRAFPGLKPEGIAHDPVTGGFRVAFDEGGKRPGRVRGYPAPADGGSGERSAR